MASKIETGIDALTLTNRPDQRIRVGSLHQSRADFYGQSPATGVVSLSESTASACDDIPITLTRQEQVSASGDSRGVEILLDKIEAAADSILTHLGSSIDSSLQDGIEDWYDLHGIESEQPYEVAAYHAAYQLFLRATLYERSGLGHSVLDSADDLWDVFDAAAAATGNPAFEMNALDAVANVVDDSVIADLVLARHLLLYSRTPADDIGWLYAQLTSTDTRETLGQFRTPPKYGAVMHDWISSAEDALLDPGVGAGVLTTAKTHSSVGSEVEAFYGVDRSPLAIIMAATAAKCCHQSVTLHEADFFEMSPGDFETDFGVICNPPYTRARELPSEYKTQLNSLVEDTTGSSVSLKSPLYVYFLLYVGQFLSPGDRGAFMTPSQFLSTEYGTAVKQYLRDEFKIHALVELDLTDERVFPDATTTGLMTFVEKSNEPNPDSTLRCIRVTDWPGTEPLLRAITAGVPNNPEWGDIYQVSQGNLDPTANWATLFNSLEIDTSQLPSLSSLATVQSGPSTGENDFFCLSESDVTEWQIEPAYRVPVAPNAASIPHYDYRSDDFERQREHDNDVWLLSEFNDADTINELQTAIQTGIVDAAPPSPSLSPASSHQETELPLVAHYLAYGRENGVHTRYDPSRRTPWFDVAPPAPAPILAISASRDEYRFVKNEAETHHLNTLYGIYPDRLDDQEEDALLAYLNSGVCSEIIRHHTRGLGDGLTKLRVTTLKDLPVLDPRTIDDDTVAALATTYDSLRDAARCDEDTAAIRAELDRLVRQAV